MAATTTERLPWVRYAEDVAEQKIPAGQLARRACERSLRDLAHYGTAQSARRDYYFDVAHGERCCEFFPRFLVHSKGEWARKPVELSPWQKFIVGSVYGWKRADGTRRFRYVYQEVARKNGKSTMLAGVGLDMLICDGEPGAEVYAAATKKDQAQILFRDAVAMVD